MVPSRKIYNSHFLSSGSTEAPGALRLITSSQNFIFSLDASAFRYVLVFHPRLLLSSPAQLGALSQASARCQHSRWECLNVSETGSKRWWNPTLVGWWTQHREPNINSALYSGRVSTTKLLITQALIKDLRGGPTDASPGVMLWHCTNHETHGSRGKPCSRCVSGQQLAQPWSRCRTRTPLLPNRCFNASKS